MATPNILHVVLTRFNVPTPGKESLIRGKPDWLHKRFGLFDDYCFPSMMAQTRKDFLWLVFFDAETPDAYKQKIETYRSLVPFTPVYVPAWVDGVLATELKKHIRPEHTHLLTSRLDNDDGLAANYVEELRKAADSGRTAFYNFTHGYILHEARVYDHTHTSNAFLSRLEPVEGARTVWAEQHQNVIEKFDVVQIPHARGWLQVIHDTNVSNKVRGTLVSPKSLASVFPSLNTTAWHEPGMISVLSDRLILAPLRALRDTTLIVGKKLLGR